MQSKTVFASQKISWIVAGFLLAMMGIGSIWDEPISCALYNESNWFGMFFAAFGEYSAALGLVSAGSMLLAGHDRKNKRLAAIQCVSGAALVGFGTLLAAVLPTLYLPFPHAALYGIGALCSAAVVFVILRLCRNADSKTVIRVALVVFISIFAEMLLVNLIKIPWGRARMRLVAQNPQAYFMPWWQAGDELKKSLVAAGVAAEEFKSFPSGHTANASMLMLLALLPQIKPKLAQKQTLLFGIGFAWACLVAFSRIIMGAHYLTDTTVGFAIGFFVIVLVCRIASRKERNDSI